MALLKTLACEDAYSQTAVDTPPEPLASSTTTSGSPTAQPFPSADRSSNAANET
jgi:hypothetical protein